MEEKGGKGEQKAKKQKKPIVTKQRRRKVTNEIKKTLVTEKTERQRT